MGRLGALLRPTWQSYAGLPPEEGACVTGLPSCCINHAEHGGESATSGGFSPFGTYGTTFPPAVRWDYNPCLM